MNLLFTKTSKLLARDKIVTILKNRAVWVRTRVKSILLAVAITVRYDLETVTIIWGNYQLDVVEINANPFT